MTIVKVYEPGAMRGGFHTGVDQVLLNHDIVAERFSAVYASSSGAAASAFWMTQQIPEAIHAWKEVFVRHEVFQPQRLLPGLLGRTLLGNTLSVVDEVMELLDWQRLDKTSTRLMVAVVHRDNGETTFREWHSGTDHKEGKALFNATGAIPRIADPVEIDGEWYVDGGTEKSLPIAEILDREGPDVKLVIMCNQPMETREPRYTRLVAGVILAEYPQVKAAFERRADHYARSVRLIHELEQQGRAFVIRPDCVVCPSFTHNPADVERAIAMGRAAAEQAIRNGLEKFIQER